MRLGLSEELHVLLGQKLPTVTFEVLAACVLRICGRSFRETELMDVALAMEDLFNQNERHDSIIVVCYLFVR